MASIGVWLVCRKRSSRYLYQLESSRGGMDLFLTIFETWKIKEILWRAFSIIQYKA